MDELIKMIAGKFNLPEETAKTVVETVLGFLKTKLPEPIASQLEGLVSGQVSAADLNKGGEGEGLLGKLSGLFGKK